MPFCRYCGTEVADGERFCYKCGSALEILTLPVSYQITPGIGQLNVTPEIGNVPRKDAGTGGTRFTRMSKLTIVSVALLALLLLSAARVVQLQNEILGYEKTITSLENQNSQARNTISSLQSQASNDASTISQLQKQNSQLSTANQHPTLSIWGMPKTLPPNGWTGEGVPDTFDYYVSFTSTVPITVYFLTFSQFIQFARTGSISSVSGQYQYFPATTSLQKGAFTLAEGCGGYIVIFQSSAAGTIYPDITARYNPAPSITGCCATPSC